MFPSRYEQKPIAPAIFAAVLLFVPVAVQTQTAAQAKHCLWQITSAKNAVYFLGSIHLLKKENYPLPEAFEKAFQEAEIIVLELNPDSLSPEKLQEQMLAKGAFPPGKTLQASLAPETYKLADERLREMGLAAALLNHFEPWLVGATITVMKMQQLGLDPNLGVDKHFFDKARQAQKEILAFETAAEQIDRIDGLSLKQQEAFLLQTLKDWELIGEKLEELLRAWSQGEIQSLESRLFESFEDFPEIYARLIKERNQNWLPRIMEYLTHDRDYLIIVGVGHLIGKDSVLQMLQERGHQIRQL